MQWTSDASRPVSEPIASGFRERGIVQVKVVYFAWVRERIGRSEEHVSFPAEVRSVGDAIGWLKRRGPEYEAALACTEVVRAALDQTHVEHTTPIAGARELALFPPVTGG